MIVIKSVIFLKTILKMYFDHGLDMTIYIYMCMCVCVCVCVCVYINV